MASEMDVNDNFKLSDEDGLMEEMEEDVHKANQVVEMEESSDDDQSPAYLSIEDDDSVWDYSSDEASSSCEKFNIHDTGREKIVQEQPATSQSTSKPADIETTLEKDDDDVCDFGNFSSEDESSIGGTFEIDETEREKIVQEQPATSRSTSKPADKETRTDVNDFPVIRDLLLRPLSPKRKKLLKEDVEEFLQPTKQSAHGDALESNSSPPKESHSKCDQGEENDSLSSLTMCITSPRRVTVEEKVQDEEELLAEVPEEDFNSHKGDSDEDLLADAPSPLEGKISDPDDDDEDDKPSDVPPRKKSKRSAKDDNQLTNVDSVQPNGSKVVLSKISTRTSIVDSLLDKFRRSNSDSSDIEEMQVLPDLLDSDDDLLVEVEPPVKFNKPSNPNLLPTPIVRNKRSISVFVDNPEEYRESVAKHHKIKSTALSDDNCQMRSRLEPPKMKAPEFDYANKPRTLAEKRGIYTSMNSNNTNTKFLMVEHEAKIFKQVQRKKQKLELNYNHLDSLMHGNIPMKLGPWKVLTWLRTRDGNFIRQYININGQNFKLNGSLGNHSENLLPFQDLKPFLKNQTTSLRSTRCCAGGKIKRRLFDELLHNESIQRFALYDCNENHKILESKFLDNQLTSIKPRPLSKKIELINNTRGSVGNDEDSSFLGNYAKFEMPEVIMEVKVKRKHALDPHIKKYLRAILPHRDLPEEWCEFALTALASSEIDEARRDTFDFKIPYENNKNCILVREILKGKVDKEQLRILPDEEDSLDNMEWTFDKDADKEDPIESEVIDIIKDLTNSVFINLNDDLFTQDDTSKTDRIMSSRAVIEDAKEPTEELSTLTRPNKSKRLLIELKKLNANVFMSDSANVEDKEDMRRYATAHLGVKERELRQTVIVTDSETVLLDNHEKDSRRIKRAPKKFEDYDNSTSKNDGSDHEEPPTKKMKPKMRLNEEGDIFTKTSHKYSCEEMKTVKKELNKLLHVNVDVHRLEFMKAIEPLCMVHELYKCECKGTPPPLPPTTHRIVDVEKPKPPARISLLKSQQLRPVPILQLLQNKSEESANNSSNEPEEELFDDGFSRRVLPVKHVAITNGRKREKAFLSSQEGMVKLEILNLTELINGGIGPIFINVYDDKTMRLNPVTRSVLNNRSAIVYFDGFGYFVDKTRVNVQKLDFNKVKAELDDPIFIIQGKDDSPPPVSSTMNDDFIKILFKKDSNEIIQIFDKNALSDISEIIDSILRNVKKKIASKIEGEPTDLIKEQLSKLTRDRSQSVSSASSSPLSFKGMRLRQAPAPGTDTQLMKDFNEIFSNRMKRLVALISSNSLGLRPSIEMLNKFYVYKWQLLLQSFEEGLVQIWQVRLESTNGIGFQMLALTESRDAPEVEFASKENIVNIRKLSLSDDITELTRLILLRVENAATTNMTIIFYGCRGYLRLCGILNSKEPFLNGFVAKPSRETHPRLAAKIQKTYNIWHQSQLRKAEKKKISDSSSDKTPVQANLMQAPQVSQKPLPLLSNARKPGQSDFKWFLFNITNDFSDIFIKTWSRYLSFKVIMEAIHRAKSQNRAIALTPNAKALKKWPRIYALPSAPLKFKEHDLMTDNYLIFGPYMRNSNSNLLLMQNVDGELMLRDDYEKINSIERDTRTRCLWIYANTLKCIQDADPSPLKLMWGKGGDEYQHGPQSIEREATKPVPEDNTEQT